MYQQITMVERRQREELEYMREQARFEKQELNRSIQMMREAGVKRQSQFQQQLNAATEREREANQTLLMWQDAYYDEQQRAVKQKREFDRKMKGFAEQSRNAQWQIQSQLDNYRVRERQQNETLLNLNRQRENHIFEMQNLRDKTESLQAELREANKPGFFRRFLGKFFN